MVGFSECMQQTVLGDIVIGMFIYSALATLLVIILIAILFKILNKDKKREEVSDGRQN